MSRATSPNLRSTFFQQTFEGAIFHFEDKQSSSLRIYCPCLYYQAIEKTFQDPSIFEPVPEDPGSIVSSLVETLQRQHGKSYPWAVGNGRQLPTGYILAKRKKEFRSGRPHIISFVDSPFRPMLNILARMIFQLISVACPNHFASGDVYTLLSILKSAPVDADLILVNQDLAGFFTSIDQDRFIGARFMLLDFLRPHIECVRQRSILGLSRKDQQSRGHHQRPYLPSPERHQEDHHQGCPGFAPVGTEYAPDIRSGAPMSSTESGQPHGQSTVTGTLPHGCIH